MSVPSARIRKTNGGAVTVAPSPVGILVIIAAAGMGPVNTPAQYTRDTNVFSTFGPGPLSEFASYAMAISENPVVVIRPTTTNAATYGAIGGTMVGSSVPTAGTTHPADNYSVIVQFLTGGTIGAAGITYQYALDGVTFQGPVALGTATTLTIPNFAQGGSPGVSFAMAAGTVVANDTITCLTAHATTTNSDISTSLEALRQSSLAWEGVLCDQDIDASTVGLLDAWLAALETVGKFRIGFLNTRMKSQATNESETSYATAMATLTGSSARSDRVGLGTDGGAVASTLTGLTLPRPTSLIGAADAMAIPIGQDPAYIGAGELEDVTIVGPNASPAYHNEEIFPNLDQLGLTALRSVSGNGVYINNARVFSAPGSSYVFWSQLRTMNRGCEVAFQLLTQQLGRGVGKTPANALGQVFMLQEDRLTINGLVQGKVASELKGQVSSILFYLNSDDNIAGNQGANVTGNLANSALALIKSFQVNAFFTN